MVHSAEDGSIPVPDMSALIARLEAAEAGSRELGRDVLIALNVVREVEPTLFYDIGNEDTWHFGDAAESEGYWRILPDPTTSLDAALALAERVLPGWVYMLVNDYCDYFRAELVRPESSVVKAVAETMPLALCIAILKAKAQGEGG